MVASVMLDSLVTLISLMTVTSLSTAMIALGVMGALQPARRITWTPFDKHGDNIVFLFRDRRLVDATPDARSLLESGPGFLEDWARVLSILQARFPDLPQAMAELPARQQFTLTDSSGGDQIEAEWRGGLVRLVLRDGASVLDRIPHDRFSHSAQTDELATLRGVVDDAPMLVWKESPDGAVRWANGAYVDLVNRVREQDGPLGWPLPRIFEHRPVGPDPAEPPRRLSIRLPETEVPRWFDCYAETRGETTLVFALPADQLVKAENTLREFIQTLTKTFAHLPTGLAVFDRDRRLALFNPALTDLSALEPLFLSGRPTLFEFLDRLREKRRMPEPKDYKGWRKRILELESAAASGTHQEVWSLPGGQTYRITGRPHPDGAIAFLFEDISAEISLTRRFRAELELGQAVVDSLDEAIAVFSSSGSLILANRAYEQLWQHESLRTVNDVNVIEATRIWRERCDPSPIWGDLRDFVGDSGERAEWTAEVSMLDGTMLSCRFTPLAGHATLAGFTRLSSAMDEMDAMELPERTLALPGNSSLAAAAS
ncbi:PAS-domain containing protein [Tropicimonas sp. IMCC34043]|uniref:PAS-domain containing protein n=1 Tax=Tropicimonas sp. IMCC34043 TaxID=2248760 RepID=UPI000E26A6D6|nr:PAS-domain containing protein [Tropicimonas sp. IMCC34043]